jgi:hypothetical protein
MTNNKKFLYIALAVATLSTSCEKNFLETNPTTQVSDQNLFTSLDGAQTVLNGTYRYQRSKSTVVESSGIISWQNGLDAASKDIIVFEAQGYMQAYYNHFILASTRADQTLPINMWQYFYTLSGNANNILANIDGIEGDATRRTQIKAQALALRAWSYFYLARLFAPTYSIGKDKPCVPFYDKPGTIGKPRETVATIYKYIVDDLKAAIPGLAGFSRRYKNMINQQVAQGILAEVYLTMEDWPNAAATAKLARTGFPIMTGDQYKTGFNEWDNTEWMWGQRQTTDAMFGDITSFTLWANKTRGTRWSFDTYCVNDQFKDLFSATDARNQFWKRVDYNLWTSDKFRDKSTGTGDVIMMRASEMLLIEAEAIARQGGQDAAAQAVLWELQDKRGATRSASTGAALINDILVERRKELYGEGFAWFDILRTVQGLTRTGDHPRIINLPARSWRMIFQLPTAEFTSNTAMTPADQNPYDGVY